MDTQLLLELFILLIFLVAARALFLIHKTTTGHSKYASSKRKSPCRTLVCAGSGGHTTEILALISTLNPEKYSPRYYFLSNTDKTSVSKIEELEKRWKNSSYTLKKIPRSRNVHQSYVSSIFTTVYSIFYTVPLVLWIQPDVILCNGPGTCVPVCLAGFLLKCACVKDTRIVFIESFCRTKSLSLTGKILVYFADNFLIQWPDLKKVIKRGDYVGQLM
ncbi:unnamed protein product [Phyllotreta striolata]|uniref:UDP-N-acetylglucosamine transferase subunit ALG14 n=1 Tax=Phyllotreta striolata TaxID=444603 RepID=A0A9N9TU54_PHYSR|nr:unnamed protein product [Phyllotreta striolata]